MQIISHFTSFLSNFLDGLQDFAPIVFPCGIGKVMAISDFFVCKIFFSNFIKLSRMMHCILLVVYYGSLLVFIVKVSRRV